MYVPPQLTPQSRWTCALAACALAWMATLTGCQPGASSAQPTEEAAAPETKTEAVEIIDPKKILADLVKLYKNATSYEDAGELHLRVEGEEGQKQESQPIPFTVAFERPNKLRVHSLFASLVDDGKQLRASTDTIENQVLAIPTPEPLTSQSLFSDPILVDAARGQLGTPMPQLALLLDADPITELAGDGKPVALASADLDGEKCHRISIEGPQGATVFWISAQDGLLRKFEFASENLRQKFSVPKLSLWADFKGAHLNKPIQAAAFEFSTPAGSKLVKYFVPPMGEAPSEMLGKTPDDFSFVDMNGGTVDRETLRGKVVVLDMWATWCGWCFRGFPNLEQVYQQYKGNDKVAILAVNKDDPSVTTQTVREAFVQAKLNIPIVRDEKQLTDKVFAVPGLPTMVVLAADGTVQDYHVGFDAKLAETLPKKIQELLDGENLAQKELDKYAAEKKAYDEKLAAASVDGAASEPPAADGPAVDAPAAETPAAGQ